MEFPFGEQVVRERRMAVPDPYDPGAMVPGSWDGPLDVLPIDNAFVASSSSTAPVDATRRQVLTEKSLYCTDPDADVRVGDRIRVGVTPPVIASVTLTWPDGSRATLSRTGNVVSCSAAPAAVLAPSSLPIPEHYGPAGGVAMISAGGSSWALALDELGGFGPVGMNFLQIAALYEPTPATLTWLADPLPPLSGGQVYYVNSRPAADMNPFTGCQPVVEIPLDMTEG